MRRRLPTLLVCCVIGLATAPARADDGSGCMDENAAADAAIEACTRIVKAGKTKGNDLAVTYYNRAISYRQKNDTDAALADYNDSIRINPKYPKAFNNRGNIWKD